MSTISAFLQKGFWFSSTAISPAIVSAPLIIESSCLIYRTCKNPGFFKTKLIEAKQGVSDFLHRKEGETDGHAIWRRVYQTAAGLGILGAMAGAVTGALYLPSTIAKATAVFSVYMIGKIAFNAKNYKDQIIHAFTVQTGETSSEAHKRIWINVCKALALCAIAAILITIGCYILPPLIANGCSWDLWSLLPFQTPVVVFAEYASLGFLHGYQAITKWHNGNKAAAAFHSLASILGIVFPSYDLNRDMRLHHNSYGLLMMALPWRPIQFLGSIITFDSLLYLIEPLYNSNDFINLLVANFPLYFNGFAAATIENDFSAGLQNQKKSLINPVENPPKTITTAPKPLNKEAPKQIKRASIKAVAI